MCARPAVHSASTPTMNLNYSSNTVKHNQASFFDLAVFLFGPWTNQRVAVPARWSQRSWPFANYRLRNPERVSFGLGAAERPTQMLMRMKRLDCAVSAL